MTYSEAIEEIHDEVSPLLISHASVATLTDATATGNRADDDIPLDDELSISRVDLIKQEAWSGMCVGEFL
ncbi:hypothetical protein GGI07_005791 [Coemansia sp. Benny D115]|nr:hypothetical protein GGI07_005791 [Coemansia sp. Benny D115]